MRGLARQDRNGARNVSDIERKYKLQDLDLTIQDVEELKRLVVIDEGLSATSKNPVQNKVITEALNNKVNKETGKGLSTNDLTDDLLAKINTSQSNAIESISVNGVQQEIVNKNANILINDIISIDINDYEGHIWYKNGVLEQWGRVNITPTAENTVTSKVVTFPIPYDYAPDISAIANTEYPVITSVKSGDTLEDAKIEMTIYMTSENTEEIVFCWKAKGYKNLLEEVI